MQKILIVFILCFGLNFTFASGQNDSISTFEEFEKEVNRLETEEKFTEAITLTKRIWNRFPAKRFELFKELEYLNTKTEQYEQNLELWDAGHREGFFFLLHPRLPQFKPYLQFSRFDTLVQADAALRETALTHAKTIYKVVQPRNFDPEKQYPLMLILHGGGSNLEMAKQRWKLLPRFDHDYIIAFIQSYRHYDSTTFGWTSSDIRAHAEIRDCFVEIIRDFPVDTNRIIIGGTSAGGTMALDLVFNEILPVQGVIGFCPGKPGDLESKTITNTSVSIYMLGGEKDYYLPRQQELARRFDQMGIRYKHIIIPGMGHTFPDNYEQAIQQALEFIER